MGSGHPAASPADAAGRTRVGDPGVTFGVSVVLGGHRGGAEGKRNSRQARGCGGPGFLGRPARPPSDSFPFSGRSVLISSSPGGLVRAWVVPSSEAVSLDSLDS